MSAETFVPPRPSLRAAANGVVFLAGQGLASRAILFFSQIALGWLLSPDDFGLIALASIVTQLAWTLIGFGADSVLQQRSRTMAMWESTAFAVGLGQGIVALVVMAVAAPLLGWLFHSPQVVAPILVTAVGMPIAGIVLVPTARAFARMDYATIAGVNIVDLLVGQGLMLAFAWAGWGALAFFLPTPICFAVRALLLWRASPGALGGRVEWRKVRIVLHRGAMVFWSRVAATCIGQGDYFVLGLFATKAAVGYYFFAFRLAAAPVRILAQSLQYVMFPMLASMRGDRENQRRSAQRAATCLSFVVTPLCILQVVLAPPLVHALFGDKWDASILIIQLLSLGLPAEAIAAVARAQMEAQGAFARALRYTMFSAAAFFTLVTAGAYWFGAVGAACAVTLYYLTSQIVIYFRVFPARGRWLEEIRAVFASPFAASLVAAGVSGSLADAFVPGRLPIVSAILITIAFVGVYAGLMRLLAPALSQEMADLSLNLLERFAPAAVLRVRGRRSQPVVEEVDNEA